jgi:hypothetical protein
MERYILVPESKRQPRLDYAAKLSFLIEGLIETFLSKEN